MATTQETRKRRSGWELCSDTACEMRGVLDELEEYSGVYEETAALRKLVDRIERICARGGKAPREEPDACEEENPIEHGGDPKGVARELIARLPLQRIFQDPALSDAFLAELLLALARESSYENRRERQRQGIEEAKAQGVRFGAPKRPLPENFEEVRRAWRNGEFSQTEAAARCGMAKSTFYSAAQRVERAMRKAAARQEEELDGLQRPHRRSPLANAPIN